ncbi:MAG: DISARM system helicase DrmA [Candidatus Dormibacteraeota bacterium]|nr:DISARM system helicase DrmA [Candidatus Dormibacteraeota bacterium]
MTITTSSSLAVRDRLEQIIDRDLLGPWHGTDEELHEGPRSRYLVGMIAPRDVRADPPEIVDSTLGDADDDGEAGIDRPSPAATSTMFPRSFGLSFAVPESTSAVRVMVSWGRYTREPSETQTTERGEPRLVWRRTQVDHAVEVPIQEGQRQLAESPWNDQPEVHLVTTCRRRGDRWIVELALVNGQQEPEKKRDEAWLFQAQLRATAVDGSAPIFLPQPDPGARSSDDEEQHLALLYRDSLEFAVGRNVTVAATRREGEGMAWLLRTEWLPAHDVPQTVAPSSEDQPHLVGLELDMRTLAELPPAALRDALMPLAAGYEAWLGEQERRLDAEPDLASHRRAAERAFGDARLVANRIRAGIELLAAEPEGLALEAFRFANQAMALQRVHTEAARLLATDEGLSFEQAVERLDVPRNRSWRPFQLAFVLLNLPGLTDPTHVERSPVYTAVVDLLFFPTGGGKTEAYLGLTAYTFAVRRLQGTVGIGADARDGTDGVAVLMRYTLRLLTAQQFQRAAAMVCACEFLRREREAAGDHRLGATPFRIGLWVGLAMTPNSYDDAAKQVRSVRGFGRGTGNHVLQVLNCPWCSAPLNESRDLLPRDDERRLILWCSDPEGRCPFSRKRSPDEGLPILTVDEEIYRLAPAMLISTVDKLAQLPWRGQAGMLFGRVSRRCSRHGYRHPDLDALTGCRDTHLRTGRLPSAGTSTVLPLRPPDLIIQDELHLISGALGTMIGQYETLVDELCSWRIGAEHVRPKIVSSTATVRRAREQVHHLFARGLRIFPPPLLDAGNTFYSVQLKVTEDAPGRRYRGICAHGIRLKQAEIRVSETLLTSTQHLLDLFGQAADPYLTYIAYFNALRELAGMKRLVDDDISIRVRRGQRDKGLADRWVPMEVQELTSRISSSRIAETLSQLEVPFDPSVDSSAAHAMRPRPTRSGRPPIDVVLATNMLQVGVDVNRIGLMVVTGQPKNTAEYIQATSRVGRDPKRPGLVLTLYNWARPRDLAHFETFGYYHETFYRRVEPLSVTPFSRRAVDRGLTGVLVGMMRNADPAYSPNLGAQTVDVHGAIAGRVRDAIAARAEYISQSQEEVEFVRDAVQARLDGWGSRRAHAEAARIAYRTGGDSIGLLRDAGIGRWDEWTVPNSLREAEPEINLLLPKDSVVDPSLHSQPEWIGADPTVPDDPELEAQAVDQPDSEPASAAKKETA